MHHSGSGRLARPSPWGTFTSYSLPASWRTPVWVKDAILTRPESGLLGTHSLRRSKATLIYRPTGNLRAVQLLLGHTKIESTVRYLGIEVDDALAIAEQVDV